MVYRQRFNGITYTVLPVISQGSLGTLTTRAPAVAIRGYVDQNQHYEVQHRAPFR